MAHMQHVDISIGKIVLHLQIVTRSTRKTICSHAYNLSMPSCISHLGLAIGFLVSDGCDLGACEPSRNDILTQLQALSKVVVQVRQLH